MSRICIELLTDDPEGVRAITDYWAQSDDLAFTHKVRAVAAVIGVRERDVARLVTQFSRAFVPEWPCGRCGGVRALASRAEYTRARPGRFEWYCRSCVERLATEADAGRRAKVQEYYPGLLKDPPQRPALVDRVFLLSLARVGEGAAPVGPLAGANPPLSPTAYMDYRIVARLHERGHIAVDPASEPPAFEWDEYDRPEAFHPVLVRWRLADVPLASADATRLRHEALAGSTEEDEAALLRLCHSILVQECFQFLGLILDRNHLPFYPGRGTRELFDRLVEDFSVAQIYNLIWRSAREVVDYSVHAAITAEHTSATVLHEISRKSEFTLAKGLELKPYRRDWGAPRSRLAEVVFDLLLDIGEEAAFLTPWRTLQHLVSERLAAVR